MVLVMLGFVAAFGAGTLTLAVGMTTLGWVVFARLSYQLTARTLSTGYVEAAIALGADSRRVLLQHVWPNIARPLLTYMALRLPSTLLAFSGLSFLGLGPRQPQAEWGAMIAEARSFADRAPMLGRRGANPFGARPMVVSGAVREVHPDHVDAGLNHALENFRRRGGGTERGDDFCVA